MQRIMQAAATLLLGLVLGLVATPAPAQASTQWNGPCSGVSIVCFAEHINGGGFHWYGSFPYGGCVNLPARLNNQVSSLWNKYGWDSSSPPLPVTGYNGSGCSQIMYTWGPEAYVLYIGHRNNDIMTSFCVGPRSPTRCP